MPKRRSELDDALVPRTIAYQYAIVAGPNVTWYDNAEEASRLGEGEEFRVYAEGPAIVVEAVDWYDTSYGQMQLKITNANPNEAVLLADRLTQQFAAMRDSDDQPKAA